MVNADNRLPPNTLVKCPVCGRTVFLIQGATVPIHSRSEEEGPCPASGKKIKEFPLSRKTY